MRASAWCYHRRAARSRECCRRSVWPRRTARRRRADGELDRARGRDRRSASRAVRRRARRMGQPGCPIGGEQRRARRYARSDPAPPVAAAVLRARWCSSGSARWAKRCCSPAPRVVPRRLLAAGFHSAFQPWSARCAMPWAASLRRRCDASAIAARWSWELHEVGRVQIGQGLRLLVGEAGGLRAASPGGRASSSSSCAEALVTARHRRRIVAARGQDRPARPGSARARRADAVQRRGAPAHRGLEARVERRVARERVAHVRDAEVDVARLVGARAPHDLRGRLVGRVLLDEARGGRGRSLRPAPRAGRTPR